MAVSEHTRMKKKRRDSTLHPNLAPSPSIMQMPRPMASALEKVEPKLWVLPKELVLPMERAVPKDEVIAITKPKGNSR